MIVMSIINKISSKSLARCISVKLNANFCTSHQTPNTKCNTLNFRNLKNDPSHQINSHRQAQTDASHKIVTESPFKNNPWWSKTLTKIGFGDRNVFALRRSTIFHYEACTDKLKPEKFFEQLRLPDTFFSFYLVVQWHVWMCQVRSMMDGPEGRILRNELMERMWQDMDTRLSKMEVFSSSSRKSLLQDLLFHHQGAMFSYDEGLLTDDKTLASALWRTLYSKEDARPQELELAVRYTRRQIEHLRSIGSREWCLNGKFDWASFDPLN